MVVFYVVEVSLFLITLEMKLLNPYLMLCWTVIIGMIGRVLCLIDWLIGGFKPFRHLRPYWYIELVLPVHNELVWRYAFKSILHLYLFLLRFYLVVTPFIIKTWKVNIRISFTPIESWWNDTRTLNLGHMTLHELLAISRSILCRTD